MNLTLTDVMNSNIWPTHTQFTWDMSRVPRGFIQPFRCQLRQCSRLLIVIEWPGRSTTTIAKTVRGVRRHPRLIHICRSGTHTPEPQQQQQHFGPPRSGRCSYTRHYVPRHFVIFPLVESRGRSKHSWGDGWFSRSKVFTRDCLVAKEEVAACNGGDRTCNVLYTKSKPSKKLVRKNDQHLRADEKESNGWTQVLDEDDWGIQTASRKAAISLKYFGKRKQRIRGHSITEPTVDLDTIHPSVFIYYVVFGQNYSIPGIYLSVLNILFIY